ncbi:MAG TPA: hypothetical protein VFN48_04300 [Solirubrobacteraceae bacterium]|nr:hypothetical protein [Solirubrobacteraceae bacterium]
MLVLGFVPVAGIIAVPGLWRARSRSIQRRWIRVVLTALVADQLIWLGGAVGVVSATSLTLALCLVSGAAAASIRVLSLAPART